MQNKKLKVWILQDGTPGHETKSAGCLEILIANLAHIVKRKTMCREMPELSRYLLKSKIISTCDLELVRR